MVGKDCIVEGKKGFSDGRSGIRAASTACRKKCHKASTVWRSPHCLNLW